MNKIEIVKEGITQLNTEAVVNAANEQLQAGGGVCKVIFQAAGPGRLQKACDDIGFCPTGSAVITPAFDLDARYIIHAVGPRWNGGGYGEKQLLYGAYAHSLELAREYGCKSIGFPLISAGIFGYPVDRAWDVAIHACNEFIRRNPDYDILIRFGVPNAENRRIGRKILELAAEDSSANYDRWDTFPGTVTVTSRNTPEQQEAIDEMNLQLAWSKARERLPQADHCVEYTDAYVFSIKDDFGIGGITSPVIVMKKSGTVMGMTAYLSESPDGRILKEHDLAKLTEPKEVDWTSIDESEARINYLMCIDNARIKKALGRELYQNEVELLKRAEKEGIECSYSIARRIAESLNPHVNACREYSDAYYFYKKDSNSDGDNGMLIMKADGSVCYSFPQFLLSRKATDQGEEREF